MTRDSAPFLCPECDRPMQRVEIAQIQIPDEDLAEFTLRLGLGGRLLCCEPCGICGNREKLDEYRADRTRQPRWTFGTRIIEAQP